MTNSNENFEGERSKLIESYRRLKDSLGIDKLALDVCLEQHPVLLHEVSSRYAQAIDIRDAEKKGMEEVYAEVTVKFRSEGLPSGAKMTEESIKQETVLDQAYIAAQMRFFDAKLDADHWKALQEAYIARGHALKTLAELWIAGYYAEVTVKGPSSQDMVSAMRKQRVAVKRREKQETSA